MTPAVGSGSLEGVGLNYPTFFLLDTLYLSSNGPDSLTTTRMRQLVREQRSRGCLAFRIQGFGSGASGISGYDSAGNIDAGLEPPTTTRRSI